MDSSEMPSNEHPYTNRLSQETSPYLLQHQHNPVDWYAWGEEAFEKARREDKPLLISIGYSACHWCHVMERESFENEAMAGLINESVVPVKVDREERPDVDAIYMHACTALTGQGGWPLNVFVTPDLKPFFVGTYFPPDDRWGRPGFATILRRIRDAWRGQRDSLTEQSSVLHKELERASIHPRSGELSADLLRVAVCEAGSHFDRQHGGFGEAPKFPPDQRLALLLAVWYLGRSPAALEMVSFTLEKMARSGMYDQLGGGFCRYSVDGQWRVPHFEKMLYNQALLVPVYLDAHLVTENVLFADTARGTLDFVLRELRSPEGMFYAALDADSEGEEGKYYVWTPRQLVLALGAEDGRLAAEYFGVTPEGNFEHGTSVLHVTVSPEEFAASRQMRLSDWNERLARIKECLLEVRSKRVRPGLDDKCLTSWNGLMISALCRGWQVLGRKEYLEAAELAAAATLQHLRPQPGVLLRSRCKGESKINGMLDDYAYLLNALVDLYESNFDSSLLAMCREMAGEMMKLFRGEDGVFFAARGDDPSLVSRPVEIYDAALPAGNSLAARGLLRLGALLTDQELIDAGRSAIGNAAGSAVEVPSACASIILSGMYMDPDSPQVVFAGERAAPVPGTLLNAVWHSYIPSRVLAREDRGTKHEPSMAHGKTSETPAAFVCRNNTCLPPVHDVHELKKALQPRTGPAPIVC